MTDVTKSALHDNPREPYWLAYGHWLQILDLTILFTYRYLHCIADSCQLAHVHGRLPAR